MYYPLRAVRRERAPSLSVDEVDLRLAQDLVDRFVVPGVDLVCVGPDHRLTGRPAGCLVEALGTTTTTVFLDLSCPCRDSGCLESRCIDGIIGPVSDPVYASERAGCGPPAEVASWARHGALPALAQHPRADSQRGRPPSRSAFSRAPLRP